MLRVCAQVLDLDPMCQVGTHNTGTSIAYNNILCSASAAETHLILRACILHQEQSKLHTCCWNWYKAPCRPHSGLHCSLLSESTA